MGREVSIYFLNILNNNLNLKPMNITNIILLTKVANPTSMVNFRPINLCNVIYKIIVKMMANFFQKVLDKCIDSPKVLLYRED